MKTFRSYLKEQYSTFNPAKFEVALSNRFGDMGRLGKGEEIESENYGKLKSLMWIFKDDPRKAVRVLMTKSGEPVAIQTWANFGFDGDQFKAAEHTIDLEDGTLNEILPHVAELMNLREKGTLNEGYHDLNPEQKKVWDALRKEIINASRTKTPRQLVQLYKEKATQLGVSTPTLYAWMAQHATMPTKEPYHPPNGIPPTDLPQRPVVKKPKAPVARKPAGPTTAVAKKNGKLGRLSTDPKPKAERREKDDGKYRSAVKIMRAQRMTDDEIVEAMDESVVTFTKALMNGTGTSLIIAGKGGTGKCLAKGTKVLMYDGRVKNVEDITEGEFVMGDDSTPRTVFGVTSGREEMYKIVPTKGDPFVVNGSHILSLKYKGQVVNISVNRFLSHEGVNFKRDAVLYRTGVEFHEQPISLDPYFLGLWLGDGNSNCHYITNIETEIRDFLNEYAEKIGYRVAEWNSSNDVSMFCITYKNKHNTRHGHTILDGLRKYDLLMNKHIPYEYLVNSRQNRLQLLAGLIDTDGYCDRGKGFEVTQKNERLADDILFLARSLGLAAYKKLCWKTCQTGNGGHYHRVTISGDCSCIPTRVARKRAEPRQQIKNVLHTGFKIEPVGEGDYYGFAVDGNHLFLLADFTVVHNTFGVRKTLGGEATRGDKWEQVKGTSSPFELYKYLFLNRNNKIVVLDDVDVFKNKDMINMLKGALESGDSGPREVSWAAAGRTVRPPKTLKGAAMQEWLDAKENELQTMIEMGTEDKWKPPAIMEFNSKVVFITNKPMEDILNDPDIGAVATRAIGLVDYDFDADLMMAKIRKVWQYAMPELEVDKPTRKRVYEVIENAHRQGILRNISLRTYDNLLQLVAAGIDVEVADKMMRRGQIG